MIKFGDIEIDPSLIWAVSSHKKGCCIHIGSQRMLIVGDRIEDVRNLLNKHLDFKLRERKDDGWW